MDGFLDDLDGCVCIRVSSLSAGFGREVPEVVGVINVGLRDGSGHFGWITFEGGR